MAYEKIDKIYYINLDKRTDRRKLIEEEIQSLGLPAEKVERWPAKDMTHMKLRSQRGAGCSISHLTIWEDMWIKGYENILVLEDDFQATKTKAEFSLIVENLFTLFQNYSVCNVGYNESDNRGITPNHTQLKAGFRKSLGVQTTSGYIMSRKAVPTLIPIIRLATNNLLTGGNYDLNAIDQAWKYVQVLDPNWILAPKSGIQRGSYSDIEQTDAEYGV